MARHEEMVEEIESEVVGFTDEVIYVALGTNVEKEICNLLWVLNNFPGQKVAILHVHWPSKWIRSSLGAKFLESHASKEQVTNHRKQEKQRMNDLLSRYINICHKSKVQVEAQVIMRKDIFDGIKELVGLCQAKRLVVGSRFMSRQADILNYCQVWLVCNGKHISTSGVILDHNEIDIRHEENQEPQALTFVEEYDEHLQFATPPNESEDEIMNNEDEDQTLMHDTFESPFTQNMAKKEANNDALLEKEVQELRIKLTKAEEQARLAKQRIVALEQIIARLKEENSDAKTEIQALRTPHHCIEFSLEDLKSATKNFHASHQIGEGGYGPVFRGLLRHTPVAIKMLNPNSDQGRAEYQQEVLVLSKIRHPNIVSLIGVCSDSSSLIYEYLPNGNVEERLAWRKKNTPPLSWQIRIRIIVELRVVLIFLHNCQPHAIVHADLKLLNILLDENNVSRLGDFGTARLIRQDGLKEATIFRQTTPMGTVGYMDPIFLSTGELTPQSDVYSFGIIILRLLTGLPVLKIAEQVEEGLRMRALRQILDASTGEWPMIEQVEKLLRLALKCCQIEQRRRPNLVSEEWRALEILSTMAGNQA